MSSALDPLRLRSVDIPHRLWLSPMCQYSAPSRGRAVGTVTDWHIAHLAARAVGGAALVCVEATAVLPDGRISPSDLGIWSDDHIDGLARLARAITASGAVPSIQIAHAGAKSSSREPWKGRGELVPLVEGGWEPRAESPRAERNVHVLTTEEIRDIVAAFGRAAARAHAAGFRVLEIHGAHGYLVHSLTSSATNRRNDDYGGSPEARRRFALEVTDSVRAHWPEALPLLFRLSATDWLEATTHPRGPGWTLDQTIGLARALGERGVDLLDISTGGLLPGIKIDTYPGYQLPFATVVSQETGLPVAAVGKISSAAQAEQIIRSGQADAVFVGRAFLRDPYWARNAAGELGRPLPWLPQYDWAVGDSPA